MIKKLTCIIALIVCMVVFILPLNACIPSISDLLNLPAMKEDGGTPNGPEVVVSGDISFHFMMLGNEYAGDCVYVKAGDNDILIDAGSRKSSATYIKEYVDDYVLDGKLEYVIATHAHQDHIAGFIGNNGIFEMFECEIIIDFPLTNSTSATYNDYVAKRDAEVLLGAKHYTALECWNNQNGASRVIELADSISMEVLYNYYYEHSGDENDYSVCVQFSHGQRKFLFTGDLELEGEEKLVEYNQLGQVELFKAGHHGSKTSSNECLLSVIKPKMCVVCCCAGSVEYTQNLENTFPTQAFINRISVYTDKVYIPIMIDLVYNTQKSKYENAEQVQLLNGNIVVCSEQAQVNVSCSNNTLKLKDTEWFKNNRICPSYWR